MKIATTPMRLLWMLVLLAVVALPACRGSHSKQPPVHIVQNMDQQPRLDPQEPSSIFKDGRGMRTPPTGTVASTLADDDLHLQDDDHLYRGMKDGAYAETLPAMDENGAPLPLSATLLTRGQQRYDIYCTPCHDAAGTGDGIIVQRGMMKPPSLHDERVRAMPIGQFYEIITSGVRNMPAYGSQIRVHDRWAIAAYVRVLQIARNARLHQVPADQRAFRRWEMP